MECKECKSTGFLPSVTGKGCSFCDGTEGGSPPKMEKTTKIASSQEFLDTVQKIAVRYLVAGDIAYTNEELTLEHMFKRFDNDMSRIMQDFFWWGSATVKADKYKAQNVTLNISETYRWRIADKAFIDAYGVSANAEKGKISKEVKE
jgi:hypothetical protein